MRKFNIVLAIIVTIIVAGCGGGGSNIPAKPKFTSQVSFGDSLSDVGSYKVGLVAALGGGQFTINAASATPATPTNWTEFTAASLGLPAPCAAETGLDNGSGAAPGTPAGTVIPVVDNPACTGYGQGGARVTNPVGVGNKLLGGGGFALTVPVVTQISHHLANTTAAPSGKFTGSELVLVMAGANDVFIQSATYTASVTGGMSQASAVANAVTAMQQAATELANDVKNQIVANGAKYVVVANIPDIGKTPYAATLTASALDLVKTLVGAFNAQLKVDLPDSANVLNIDAFTASGDEVNNPAKYNLSNVTIPACNIAVLPGNSSLFCTSASLITAADSHYLYADAVHPTPYGHALFAMYILQAMTAKGWY